MITKEEIQQRVIEQVRKTVAPQLHILGENKEEQFFEFLHNTVGFQVETIDWDACDDVNDAIMKLADEFMGILSIVLGGLNR